MSCFGFGKQEFCQLLLPELMKTKVAWTHANDGSHASFVLVSLNATAQWNENKNFTRTEYSNDRKFTCIEFSIYLLDYIHTRADEFGTLPKFLRFHFIRTGIPTVRCDRIRATCECERRNLVNLSRVSKSRNLGERELTLHFPQFIFFDRMRTNVARIYLQFCPRPAH